MAGIQLSGLVSGLDTQSIISQLMAVERQPRTRITG
jgi:flagellar capping protein FliD